MNIWENAVITIQGLSLLSKLMEGNSLEITKAETGAGYVTPGLLAQQTKVSIPKQTLIFRKKSYPEEGKCALPCYLTNEGLTSGYTAKQVGLYAVDPDDGEILFSIVQAPSDSGTVIPSESEMAGYSAEWTLYFQYGQASGVSVTVDPTRTVTTEEMEKALAGKQDKVMCTGDTIDVYDYGAPGETTIIEYESTGLVVGAPGESGLIISSQSQTAIIDMELGKTKYRVQQTLHGSDGSVSTRTFYVVEGETAIYDATPWQNITFTAEDKAEIYADTKIIDVNIEVDEADAYIHEHITSLHPYDENGNETADITKAHNGIFRIIGTEKNGNASACTFMTQTIRGDDETKTITQTIIEAGSLNYQRVVFWEAGAYKSGVDWYCEFNSAESTNNKLSAITEDYEKESTDFYPSVKAMVDYINSQKPIYSTEDIEAGVTPLETGRMYLVYE